MKIPYFQQIVNMRSFSSQILNDGVWRELQWENTNRLLDFGYLGVKTGITNEAGPCLASFFKTKNAHYLIVILNSSSKEERWVDTCKLVEWVSKLYEHWKSKYFCENSISFILSPNVIKSVAEGPLQLREINWVYILWQIFLSHILIDLTFTGRFLHSEIEVVYS